MPGNCLRYEAGCHTGRNSQAAVSGGGSGSKMDAVALMRRCEKVNGIIVAGISKGIQVVNPGILNIRSNPGNQVFPTWIKPLLSQKRQQSTPGSIRQASINGLRITSIVQLILIRIRKIGDVRQGRNADIRCIITG